MADNIAAATDATKQLATDEIGGVHFARTKIVLGDDGVNGGDVSAANPLPITGTVGLDGASLAALEAITVGGTVDLGATSLAALESITAAGPLTNTELRSAAVAVSAASLPLPTGAATETTLGALNTKVPSGLTVATGRLVVDGSGVTQPVSGPLTDIQLRAAAVAVSLASQPLPTGAATETSLAALLAAYKAEDSPAVSGDLGLPMLGMRWSADTPTTDNDGDYTLLKVDEEGRLKVATKPASYPDITGDITAIQATIGTPVAGGTVSGDVSRASNVMAFCTGTFAGVNCSFEGSLEATGDTNWFGIQAVRSNANTIETATGALSAQPAYAWELSVNALKRVRVRATARTSGTQSWRFVLGTYATEPIPAAQVSATQPISGTVTATVTPPAPTTPYFLNSAGTTNAALIITGTSAVTALHATNTGATVAYLKLYNKATAPTVGTDVPEMIIPIPAAVSGVPGMVSLPIGFIGFRFALGLGIAITGGAADTDTTAVAAGQVKVKLSRTT